MNDDLAAARANVAVLRGTLKWVGAVQMLTQFVVPPLTGSATGPVIARASSVFGVLPCALAATTSATLLMMALWFPRLRVPAAALYSVLALAVGLVGWSVSLSGGLVFVFGLTPIGIALATAGAPRGG